MDGLGQPPWSRGSFLMTKTQLREPPAARPGAVSHPAFHGVAAREQVSNRYWSRRDPINELRTWWRAQTVRHLFHVLPGQSILELGCGCGSLTRALVRATRGECPITAATFCVPADHPALRSLSPQVEVL